MFEERFRQVHNEYASKAVAEYAEYLLSCPDYDAIELLILTVAMGVAIDNYIFNELASKTLTLNDLTGVNYSSIRQGALELREEWFKGGYCERSLRTL